MPGYLMNHSILANGNKWARGQEFVSPSSDASGTRGILPQANKCRSNAVVRKAAFRRSREQASETP
jgi:hypothetical protein